MKIAMLGHKRVPSREGGVEIVVDELSRRMARAGHAVICYNRSGHHICGAEFDNAPQTQSKNIQYRSVWTWDKKGLAAVTSSFFAAVCAAFSRAKVVHIHAEGPAFMSWLPRLLGKRVIVTVHGLDWQREKWKAGFGAKYIHLGEKMAVKFAHEIIVLSRNVQEYFRSTYARDTVWIPNGVSKPELAEPEQIGEQFDLGKDSYILFLGRLVPEKGVHHLIEAFRNVQTDKKLVIAGGSSDSDDYAAGLRAAAEGDDRIVFTGFVQGRVLAELYSNAYVYVLPSDVEGMPLSLLEAMSYGRCCLVSDIPECTEVVEDRAVTFPHDDVDALAKKLQFLSDNVAIVEDYRKQVADYICSCYDWDTVVAETLRLYGEESFPTEEL